MTMTIRRWLAVVFVAVVFVAGGLSPAWAAEPTIQITHPWARASASAMVKVGGVFLDIKNTGTTDDRLLSVSCEAAAMTQLHSTASENGVMTMRQSDGFDVRAGQSLVLKPGGNHVMLMGLKTPLKNGGTVVVTLTFAKAGAVTVAVPIAAADALEAPAEAMGGY